MSNVFANRVLVRTASTGTVSPIVLGTALAGYRTFAAAGVTNGAVVRYLILDGNSWEIGTGTYTASGTTLTRTVQQSSAGGTTPINLSGGADVSIIAAAQDYTSFYRPANLLGTVSESGGVPTGAVMETGFVADRGFFERFACGYQVCYSTLLYDSAVSGLIAVGATLGVTWTLPIAFAANSAVVTPILAGAAGTTSVQVDATAQLSAAAQFHPTTTAYIAVHNSSAGTRPIRLLARAEGRWF